MISGCSTSSRSSRSSITQKRLVGEKTYENKSCLSRRFTSIKFIFSPTINSFWVISDLDDRRMYCILRSSRSSITKKLLVGEKLIKTKVAYLEVLRLTYSSVLLPSTDSELSTILMIGGCTSLVHPQIIKIVNNSETVGRRKNLYKTKVAYLDVLRLIQSSSFGYDQWFLSH